MSLWDPDFSTVAQPSFISPIDDPGTDPTAGPFVCVQFAQSWLELVCGCLLQLCQPASYKGLTPTQLVDVLNRATALLNLFMSAGSCFVQQKGAVTATITPPSATVTQHVTFSTAYGAAPTVLATSETLGVDVYIENVTDTGFDLQLAASVAVVDPTDGIAAWVAFG